MPYPEYQNPVEEHKDGLLPTEELKSDLNILNIENHINDDYDYIEQYIWSDDPMCNAIHSKDSRALEILLNKGYDPNLQGALGHFPLIEAVRINSIELVKILLQHENIDVNVKDSYKNTPLTFAVLAYNEELVEILLQHKDIDVNVKDLSENTILNTAIAQKHEKIAVMLLQHKNIDVNILNRTNHTPLMYAIEDKKIKIITEILKKENINLNVKDTIWEWTVFDRIDFVDDKNALITIKLFLNHLKDPNSIDQSLLGLIITNYHNLYNNNHEEIKEIIKILLEKKANPNALIYDINAPTYFIHNNDNNAFEELLAKIEEIPELEEFVEKFLEKGGNPNYYNNADNNYRYYLIFKVSKLDHLNSFIEYGATDDTLTKINYELQVEIEELRLKLEQQDLKLKTINFYSSLPYI